MKKALTYLFLIPLTTFGQMKFDGTFCSKTDFVGFCLTFKNDSLFDYSSWTCLGGIKGNGIYKIKKKTLTFRFVSDDTLKNTVAIDKTNCNNNDSITLHFSIIDKKFNEPMQAASINLKSSSVDSLWFSSDQNGNANLKIRRTDKEYWVSTSYIGYKGYSFKINPDNCMDIKIFLVQSWGIIENGEIWKFKIKKHNSKRLILQDNEYKTSLYKKKK